MRAVTGTDDGRRWRGQVGGWIDNDNIDEVTHGFMTPEDFDDNGTCHSR